MKAMFAGARYGRLVCLTPYVDDKHSTFVCDCGNTKTAYNSNVRRGLTQSCGCLHKEKSSEASRTHGMAGTPMYLRWRAMLHRCYSPKDSRFARYGGRGIYVCARWHNFSYYYEDVGQPPFEGAQLDRIDNDGPYCASNVRWVSPPDNVRNSSTAKLTRADVAQIKLSDERGIDLAKQFGVSPAAISAARTGRTWSKP